DPIAYQKTLDTPENLEKKYDILKSYFRYWAYQSIGNFRLYKATHDRYFVDKIATKLYTFEGNGYINILHTLYTEYLENEKEIEE
ncbi:hypothetical protein VWM66_10340, partial [Campylobacter jejuni]